MIYRVCFRGALKDHDRSYEGLRYSQTQQKIWNGIYVHVLETEFSAPFMCRFIREGVFERICVTLGIGDEIQTGDAEFDSRVFIVGDHPLLADYICQRAELRAFLIRHIGAGVKAISITGKSVQLELDSEADVTKMLPLLPEVLSHFKELSGAVKSRLSDRFYRRALIAEGLVFATIGYGFGTHFELATSKENIHVNSMSLMWPGIYLGFALLASAMGLLWLFLRSSSRAPRIIVECGLLLLIALPAIGVQLLADVNQALDRGEVKSVIMIVTEAEMKYHHSRKQDYYSYELEFDADRARENGLPRRLWVSPKVFKKASTSRQVSLEISPGFLGFPWFKSIQ